MLSIIVIACSIVLIAMIIDLISGVNKAKIRGEIRSSLALKRSLSKFIPYDGVCLLVLARIYLYISVKCISYSIYTISTLC